MFGIEVGGEKKKNNLHQPPAYKTVLFVRVYASLHVSANLLLFSISLFACYCIDFKHMILWSTLTV